MTYLMQALSSFFRNQKIFSAIRDRQSLRRGNLHPLAHSDVLLSHTDCCVPELVPSLSDAACRLLLIRRCFSSQVAHLKFCLWNSGCFPGVIEPFPEHTGRHRLPRVDNYQTC